MPGLDLSQVSSNWKRLQSKLQSEAPSDKTTLKRKRKDEVPVKPFKRVRDEQRDQRQPRPSSSRKARMGNMITSTPVSTVDAAIAAHADLKRDHDISNDDLSAAYGNFAELGTKDKINVGRHSQHKIGKYVALDCEMVGTGPPPHTDDVLARVSIVNFHGEQIYDTYVQAPRGVKVQDYRTHVSGIRREHMLEDTAKPFVDVQREVSALLKDRILVGHALKKDLQCLQINHAQQDIRDTSRHAAFRVESKGKPPALRKLAVTHLGLVIQQGAHSSLEDARATMLLYKKDKAAFETEARRVYGAPRARPSLQAAVVNAEPDAEDSVLDDDLEDDLDSELLDGEDEDLDSADQPATLQTKKKRKKKKRTKR